MSSSSSPRCSCIYQIFINFINFVSPSQLSIKPPKYAIFARFPTRSDADLLLARGALELRFVRKNAKTTKSLSDASVFDSRMGFIGSGDAILQ